jgi:hypothetical protein
LLPDHICENSADRHGWRAYVLGFIREHIDSSEVYRLGEADLTFGELLPEKPGWLEQEEYEERTGVAFHLERLTKRIGEVLPRKFVTMAPRSERRVGDAAARGLGLAVQLGDAPAKPGGQRAN